MMMYGTNSSRNAGWGMDLQAGCNSVDMFGGSFVLNGGGGINCPNGFRFMIAPNGENTGVSMSCRARLSRHGDRGQPFSNGRC
jgi:hypothetical protein